MNKLQRIIKIATAIVKYSPQMLEALKEMINAIKECYSEEKIEEYKQFKVYSSTEKGENR